MSIVPITAKNIFNKTYLKVGDFETKKVSKLVDDSVDLKECSQFDIDAYYRANVKVKDAPIQTQSGLQNFSSVKFGDERIWYERSFSQDAYNPEMKIKKVDLGLTEDQLLERRKKDYAYALKQVPLEEIEMIELTMKKNLKQRTSAGSFQLRMTFKYFDRDSSGAIDFSELNYALQLMGFTFTENQVLALFAHYDSDYSGEIGYNEFIGRLTDTDFEEVNDFWVPKKGEIDDGAGGTLPISKNIKKLTEAEKGKLEREAKIRAELQKWEEEVEESKSLGM